MTRGARENYHDDKKTMPYYHFRNPDNWMKYTKAKSKKEKTPRKKKIRTEIPPHFFIFILICGGGEFGGVRPVCV